ncbi:TPA: aerotolerance protein BatD [Elizabethkingia meningoseptica]
MNRSVLYILFLLYSLQLSAQVEMETYVDEKASYKIGQEIPIVFVATSKSSREMQMKLPYFDPKKYDVFLQESNKDYYLDDRGVALTKFSALVVVKPKVAGPLRIGSAQVVVDNTFYKTEIKDIFVKNEKYVEYKPPIRNNNEVYIRMSVSDNDVYVNQATMAVVTAYSRNMNSLDNVEDVQLPEANGVKYHKVGISNGEVNDDNEEYSMRVSVYLVFPEIPGKTILPPASAKVAQGGSVTKIKSNSVNLNVKPLPEAAPADFQNAVGKYDAQISVKTPGDLEINKPVSVEVKLSGVGNLKDVELPKFANSEYYSVYKPNVTYNVKPAGHKGFKGEVTANYIIVPKKQGNLPIALEGFSYFDPEDKKYKQVALSTLPLFVQTAEQIASDKSTVEKVMENTASVLNQKVKIPVIAQVDAENSFLPKSSENIPIWILFLAFAFVAFFLYFFYKVYNSNKAASPTGKNYSPHFKGMTNIEDSEKMIRQEMAVDIPAHLHYLETLIQQKDYSGFFTAYSDMNAELEQDVDIHHNTTLARYIEDTLGHTELEAFKNLQSRVEIVRFSPFKEEDSMKDLLQQVCSVYEKIEK